MTVSQNLQTVQGYDPNISYEEIDICDLVKTHGSSWCLCSSKVVEEEEIELLEVVETITEGGAELVAFGRHVAMKVKKKIVTLTRIHMNLNILIYMQTVVD